MSDIHRAGFRFPSSPVNPAHSHFLPPSSISTSSAIFPLPLLPFPSHPASTSRRVHQIHTRACRVVALANECIRALNTVYFNYPSSRFVRFHMYRSTVPSVVQRRIHDRIMSATTAYFYSSRQLRCKQPSTGRPASTRTAPRVGLYSPSLVISPPRSLSPVSALASLTGDNPFSRPSSSTFDLSVALRTFDTVLTASPTTVVGLPSSYDTSSGVLPIVADRVSLPDNLQHVSILDRLPDAVRTCYSSSSSLLLPAEVATERVRAAGLRKPRVLATRTEYVKLVQRMLKLGMLQLTSTPRCVNSLFGVPKGDDIRLILDARLANCYFVDAPRIKLPSPSHLAQLQATGAIAVAKCDLSNFYHQLVLPDWIRSYFALPALTSRERAELASCGDLPPSVRAALSSPSGRLFPCCVTLPMGFSHSVFLAQCVHEHVLYSYSCLSPRDNVLNLVSPLIDRPLHALYVDDCVLMGPSAAAVAMQYASVQQAYAVAQLPVKQSKCTTATTAPVTVLGVNIHGARGTISLSIERHSRIVHATASLLTQPLVSARELAQVVGAWTWQLLLRRPALAALKHCYRFVDRYMDRPPRRLWPCAARELTVLTALSPLLSVDLRAPWSTHLVATDASSYAAGVVAAPLHADVLHALWPQSTVHLPSLLQQRHPSVVSTSHSLSVPLVQPSAVVFPVPQCDADIARTVQASRWSTLVSHAWERRAHINGLELEAMHLGLRWYASLPSSIGARLPLLLDSSAAYYITRKGRTSTAALLSIFRRCSALTLALSASLAPMWLPSQLNPADSPSRSMTASASGKSRPGRQRYE